MRLGVFLLHQELANAFETVANRFANRFANRLQMACHGQCVSSAALQQPANFNVVLVKKTEMVSLQD